MKAKTKGKLIEIKTISIDAATKWLDPGSSLVEGDRQVNPGGSVPEELPPRLLIDLRRVERIDQFGISWLVETKLAMHERDGKLVLVGPSPVILALLKDLDLLDLFEVLPSSIAALKWLRSSKTSSRFVPKMR